MKQSPAKLDKKNFFLNGISTINLEKGFHFNMKYNE